MEILFRWAGDRDSILSYDYKTYSSTSWDSVVESVCDDACKFASGAAVGVVVRRATTVTRTSLRPDQVEVELALDTFPESRHDEWVVTDFPGLTRLLSKTLGYRASCSITPEGSPTP